MLATRPPARAAPTVRDIVNGNGVFEPGEKIELDVRLRNRGVVAATGAEVRLVSRTPFAIPEVGSVAAGTVAPFTDWSSTTPGAARNAPNSGSALSGTVRPLARGIPGRVPRATAAR